MYRRYQVELETITELLGTQPVQEIRQEHLPTREDEEVFEGAGEEKERPTTFYVHDGKICLMDYQVKGWFKEAFGEFPQFTGIKGRTKEWASATTVKGRIDKWLFISPRYIPFVRGGREITKPESVLSRIVRGMGVGGVPRVVPVNSDSLDPGVRIAFQIKIRENCPIDMEALKGVLPYGEEFGLLGWRSAGFGSFKVISIQEV
ncbi:hypothetical protein M1O54_00015 [Dehalococcoidia bacterium]|nr:hypothetical protein [Dehalococcoidia bacterium]